MASGLRMMVTTDPSARRWMISFGRSTFQWKPPFGAVDVDRAAVGLARP